MAETETIATALVGIGADTSALSTALAGIPAQVQGTQTAIDTGFSAWGPKLTSIGMTLTAAITAPIIGAAGAVVAMGIDFEREMSRVAALSEASKAELDKLKETANSLAIDFPQTATQIAKAMGDMAAAGYGANEIIGAMPGILALATSEQVSVAKATDAVTTALNLFKMPAEQAIEVADMYARATADSRVNLTDLAKSMEYAGPIAASLNIPLADTVAAMQTMAENGIEASKAGTAFRQFINDLINPTKAAQEALSAMNVEVKDADGNLRPLPDLVKQFYEAQQTAADKTLFVEQAFKIWGQRTSDVLGLIAGGDGTLDKFRSRLDESEGSAKKMSDIIQDNVKGSLDKLHSATGALANQLYEAFAPAIKGAVDWLVGLAETASGAAAAFKDLPQWVQLSVLAIGGIATAIGPVLVSIGLFMNGWTTIAPAVTVAATAIYTFSTATVSALMTGLTSMVTGIGAAITSIGGIVGVLALVESAIAVAAAAFAGWQLGSWLYAHIPLVREFGDAIANMVPQSIFDRIAGLGGSMDNLDYATKKLEASLAAKGITVSKTGLTVEEYSAKLRTAAAELTTSTTKTDGAGTATEGWRVKLEALKTQHDAAMASISASGTATDKHASSTASAGVEARLFTVDLEALTLKMREAQRVADDAELDKAFIALNNAIMNTPTAVGEVPPVIQDLTDDIEARMSEADVAFTDTFEGASTSAKTAATQSRSAWTEFGNDLKQVLSNFVGDITHGLFALLTGSHNEELEKQRAALLDDLADRKQDWADYEADVAQKFAEITQKHDDALASELTKLQEKLDDKTLEYDRYVRDVNQKMESIVTKGEERLQQDLEKLQSSLESRTLEYDRYVTSINEKMDAIVSKNEDSLNRELDKLQSALDDKRTAYDRYVEDINLKLDRITENFDEAVDDQTRTVRRGIEDKIREFERYEADINAKIAAELAKGASANMAQVESWRTSLERRREDLGIYITRANEDLAEFTSDQLTKANQQRDDALAALKRREEDFAAYVEENKRKQEETTQKHRDELAAQIGALQTQLEQRRYDFEQYVEENKRKQEETTTKHHAEMAAQIAALQQALADRKADFEAYQANIAAAVESATAKHKAELEKERADLQATFTKKQEEYDAHLLELQSRLDELEGKHKTAFGVIKDAFVAMLGGMGEAVVTFISDYLAGKLIGALTGLVDDVFPRVGGALAKVFNIGGDAAGSATGGAASAAGSAATGIAGATTSLATGIAGGIVSAVGAIAGGLITGAMLGGDLGHIEENTRGTLNQLRDGVQPRLNDYLPYLDNLSNNRYLESINSEIIHSKDHLWVYLPAIAEGIAAMSGVSIDGVVPSDGTEEKPLSIDPAVFDGIAEKLAEANGYLTDIRESVMHGVELQEIALQSGGGGSTITGDMLVGGGGIGTLNVTVNAETTSSADEIAGMVLEQILVYVPTGGA